MVFLLLALIALVNSIILYLSILVIGITKFFKYLDPKMQIVIVKSCKRTKNKNKLEKFLQRKKEDITDQAKILAYEALGEIGDDKSLDYISIKKEVGLYKERIKKSQCKESEIFFY